MFVPLILQSGKIKAYIQMTVHMMEIRLPDTRWLKVWVANMRIFLF